MISNKKYTPLLDSTKCTLYSTILNVLHFAMKLNCLAVCMLFVSRINFVETYYRVYPRT